ncbi:MAG: hypothetical protein ABI947_26250 [Chloroflexota bacterium]
MAKKKSRRPNLSQETLERARAEMRGDLTPITEAPLTTNGSPAVVAARTKVKRTGSAALATRHIPSTQELMSEYAYVLQDLRNLAILAAVLMLIIIVAAVALPRPTG